MWCEKCQSDVAAQASLDSQRLHCASCGSEVTLPPSSAAAHVAESSSPRDARELLARWAQEEALDPFGPLLSGREEAKQSTAPVVSTAPIETTRPSASPPRASVEQRTAPRAQQSFRVDAPHEFGDHIDHRAEEARRHSPTPHQQVASPQVVYSYIHPPERVPAPHFDLQTIPTPEKTTNWVALAGQLFAYLGVAVLTIGAVMVLVGYFGGPATYTSRGWLVTTAGQMMLFLGVVTLISGGMDQTTQEVSRKIDTLGAKLVRIEQATGSLSGPHFPAQRTSETVHPTEQELRDQIAHLSRQLDQYRS